VKSAL
jgi:hypothetical protein